MILKFWHWLFGKGCEHKWKIYQEGNIYSDGKKIGNYYDLQCVHCGEMKTRKSI